MIVLVTVAWTRHLTPPTRPTMCSTVTGQSIGFRPAFFRYRARWILLCIFIFNFFLNLFVSFPFDEQRCFFKFGSWTYDGTKLDLKPDAAGMDMSEYLVNGEWNLYRKLFWQNAQNFSSESQTRTSSARRSSTSVVPSPILR